LQSCAWIFWISDANQHCVPGKGASKPKKTEDDLIHQAMLAKKQHDLAGRYENIVGIS